MAIEELAALLKAAPDERLAFLPDQTPPLALAETLAALANSAGGVVLVGVTPRGAVTGLADPDATEQRALMALLELNPPMVGGVVLPYLAEHDGRDLLVIEVPPALGSVFRVGSRYLGRQGAANIELETHELRDLIVNRRELPFERQVPQGAHPRDLSRAAIEQYLDHIPSYDANTPGAAQRATEHLRRRGVLRPEDGLPTYAGLLLFGREAQQWLPSAQILIARYPGTELGDHFIRQQVDGPLPQQIRQAETFLLDNMRRSVVMRGLQREERLEYPRDAVREAIVNAVAHRDYSIRGAEIQIFMFSNRIELLSPGRLPGHITPSNILNERFSRNESIVQVLSDLGFIERLGYGIDRIFKLMGDYGLPEPLLEETANGFRMTLFGPGEALAPAPAAPVAAPAAPPADALAHLRHLGLNPRQMDALEFVQRDGRITNRDFQELWPDVSAETLRRDLADLVGRGILLRIGEKKATYYILK